MVRLSILILAMGLGCSSPVIDLAGRPCDDEQRCIDGFLCNPLTGRCGREQSFDCAAGGLCGSDITSGSACSENQSFVPCVTGLADCSMGCRSCQDDGTWSECSDSRNETPGVPEVCDGTDTNGDGNVDEENAIGCVAYYRDDDEDGAGSLSDTKCLCAPLGDYSTTDSSDCDDNDIKVISSCDTCRDNDADNYWVGCDDYTG
ncbi:MAG: hypothetical protein AAF658_18640, partial [Myxococcota bacterium]